MPARTSPSLDDKSPYGQGLANNTQQNMEKAGLKTALRDTYNAGDKDFSALLNKMKEAKIAAVFVGGYHPDVALMMRQAQEQGFKAAFVSGDAMNTKEFWSILRSGRRRPALLGCVFGEEARFGEGSRRRVRQGRL